MDQLKMTSEHVRCVSCTGCPCPETCVAARIVQNRRAREAEAAPESAKCDCDAPLDGHFRGCATQPESAPAQEPGEVIHAQHGETGRMWTGPRAQMPQGYAEVGILAACDHAGAYYDKSLGGYVCERCDTAGVAAPAQEPDDDMVICPGCVHQFRAVPINVQTELAMVRDALREWIAAEDAQKTAHDCPRCSFRPTTRNDFCNDHRPGRLAEARQAARRVLGEGADK